MSKRVSLDAASCVTQRCIQIDLWMTERRILDEHNKHVIVAARPGRPSAAPDARWDWSNWPAA